MVDGLVEKKLKKNFAKKILRRKTDFRSFCHLAVKINIFDNHMGTKNFEAPKSNHQGAYMSIEY